MTDDKQPIREGGDLYNDILNKPDALASLQNIESDAKLQALENYQRLPECIKRRVRALKKLQNDTVTIDIEFYKKLFELEVEYDVQHHAVFAKRRTITSGEHEPTEEECDWPSDEKELDMLTESLKGVTVKDETNEAKDENVKGIPEFWFTVFKNTPVINTMIQPHDEPILKCLDDVRCVLVQGDDPGFIIEFHFSENQYFTNSVLTKQYFFQYSPSEESPLEYDGPEIVRTKGCAISWKPGQNVTVKTLKKLQKHKRRGETRAVMKTVKEDSFFNFFDPPLFDLSSKLDEETEDLLESDFKIGQSIRESLIPRAVLYFTGEALEEEYEDDEDEEDEDEDEEDEDEDEHDSQNGTENKQKSSAGRDAGGDQCTQQ